MAKDNISLDTEFELFLKISYPEINYDISLINNRKGCYKDQVVAVMYSAFKRCYKDSIRFFTTRAVSKVNIIATSENGKLKFSNNIYIHNTVEGAQLEAIRLSNKLKTVSLNH